MIKYIYFVSKKRESFCIFKAIFAYNYTNIHHQNAIKSDKRMSKANIYTQNGIQVEL